MSTVLFLSHRMPYPPNKGDKVRSFHVLKHLLARHQVLLGTLVDDAEDEQHIGHLRSLCAEIHVGRLHPLGARMRCLRGLALNEPLSLSYFRDAGLHKWVGQMRRRGDVDAVWVFSSSMLPYSAHFQVPIVVDFADVDSEKWAEYGRTRHWPLSWIFRREARTLRCVEREGGARARWSLFATEEEAKRFRALAPQCADRTEVMNNGVDSTYFAPTRVRQSPYPADVVPLVFVGTMDYWPNVDAVKWLVQSIWPQLLRLWPRLRLFLVGRRPTRAVLSLAGDSVVVTGSVPDVRPYLQHARVVLAPVRLATGIQNKVLESMAMARPVVATARCAEAIKATVNEHLLTADRVEDYVREVSGLLEAPLRADALGKAAREHVVAHFSWATKLGAIDRYIPAGDGELVAA